MSIAAVPLPSAFGFAFLAGIGHLLPASVRAQDEIRSSPCMDDAWSEYNACLVGSGSEFGRRICDIAFIYDTLECVERREYP